MADDGKFNPMYRGSIRRYFEDSVTFSAEVAAGSLQGPLSLSRPVSAASQYLEGFGQLVGGLSLGFNFYYPRSLSLGPTTWLSALSVGASYNQYSLYAKWDPSQYVATENLWSEGSTFNAELGLGIYGGWKHLTWGVRLGLSVPFAEPYGQTNITESWDAGDVHTPDLPGRAVYVFPAIGYNWGPAALYVGPVIPIAFLSSSSSADAPSAEKGSLPGAVVGLEIPLGNPTTKETEKLIGQEVGHLQSLLIALAQQAESGNLEDSLPKLARSLGEDEGAKQASADRMANFASNELPKDERQLGDIPAAARNPKLNPHRYERTKHPDKTLTYLQGYSTFFEAVLKAVTDAAKADAAAKAQEAAKARQDADSAQAAATKASNETKLAQTELATALAGKQAAEMAATALSKQLVDELNHRLIPLYDSGDLRSARDLLATLVPEGARKTEDGKAIDPNTLLPDAALDATRHQTINSDYVAALPVPNRDDWLTSASHLIELAERAKAATDQQAALAKADADARADQIEKDAAAAAQAAAGEPAPNGAPGDESTIEAKKAPDVPTSIVQQVSVASLQFKFNEPSLATISYVQRLLTDTITVAGITGTRSELMRSAPKANESQPQKDARYTAALQAWHDILSQFVEPTYLQDVALTQFYEYFLSMKDGDTVVFSAQTDIRGNALDNIFLAQLRILGIQTICTAVRPKVTCMGLPTGEVGPFFGSKDLYDRADRTKNPVLLGAQASDRAGSLSEFTQLKQYQDIQERVGNALGSIIDLSPAYKVTTATIRGIRERIGTFEPSSLSAEEISQRLVDGTFERSVASGERTEHTRVVNLKAHLAAAVLVASQRALEYQGRGDTTFDAKAFFEERLREIFYDAAEIPRAWLFKNDKTFHDVVIALVAIFNLSTGGTVSSTSPSSEPDDSGSAPRPDASSPNSTGGGGTAAPQAAPPAPAPAQ